MLYHVTLHEIVTTELEVLATDMDDAKRKATKLHETGTPGTDFIQTSGGIENIQTREIGE